MSEALENNCYVTPEIVITVNDIKFKVLIDTGSDVTCMSESIYHQYKHLWGNCSIMPTKQFTLITAGSKKTAKITK